MKNKKWKVFIGSTDYDLKSERIAVANLIEKFGYEAIAFKEGKFIIDSNVHSHETCILSVKTSDIFILILKNRYGGSFKGKHNEISITHKEYLTARENNIPTIILVHTDLEKERFHFVNGIKKSNKSISRTQLISKLKKVEPKFANDPNLLCFLEKIRLQKSGNYIQKYSNLDELIKNVEKGLIGLAPTILKKLVEQQNKVVNSKFVTIGGGEYTIKDLIKHRLYVKQSVEAKSQKIPNYKNIFETYIKSLKTVTLVLGDPGTGKSILLSNIFLYACDKYLSYTIKYVPIFFELKYIKDVKHFSREGILERVFDFYFSKDLYPSLDFSITDFFFVLDGLDELSELIIKKIVVGNGFTKFINSSSIISVRSSYYEIFIKGYNVEQYVTNELYLNKWKKEQGIDFIEKYLKLLNSKITDVFKAFNKPNELNEIFTSPIMSSMYGYLIGKIGRIPEEISDRATLYENFMDVLIKAELNKNKEIKKNLDAKDKLKESWQYSCWEIFSHRLEMKTLYIAKLKSILSKRKIQDIYINQTLLGLVKVDQTTEKIESLFHETLLEFILAHFGVHGMLCNNNDMDLFLNANLTNTVSLFVKEIWKRMEEQKLNLIISNLTHYVEKFATNLTKNSQRKAANGIYYLSRIPLPDEVTKSLKRILSNKLSSFVKGGTLIALTKLGDKESEELLTYALLNNKQSNKECRGLHLEYFGDILPNSSFPPIDSGSKNVDKTIMALLNHLERANKRDAVTARIDTITILSLCKTRNILTPNITSKLRSSLQNLKLKFSDDPDIPTKALHLVNNYSTLLKSC